jgi:UPF0755 protein
MSKAENFNTSQSDNKENMPKPIRIIFKIVTTFIILGLIFFVSGAALFMYLNKAPDTLPSINEDLHNMSLENGNLFIEVKSGESGMSVGKRLEEAGIIRSQYLWALLSRIDKRPIKAGFYSVEMPVTQIEMRSTLVTGKQLLFSVTIPEGGTLKKTARILEDAEICSAEDFLAAAADEAVINRYRIPGNSSQKTMEGYLYPDTYLFPRAFPAEQVVETMADTFFAKLTDIAPSSLSLSPEELNRRVILASIVEREYRVPEEAPIMAGVFYNRLDIGMALESCATVEYVITEIQGKPHPEVIYYRDLEIRDPYNTYIRPGLPPGPISEPGEIALRAVFEPMESDYLYFRVIDPNAGKHYFSRTYDDHIQAGVLYTKRR